MRVEDLGFGAYDSRVYGLQFRVESLGFRVESSGFRGWDLEIPVQVSGFEKQEFGSRFKGWG